MSKGFTFKRIWEGKTRVSILAELDMRKYLHTVDRNMILKPVKICSFQLSHLEIRV